MADLRKKVPGLTLTILISGALAGAQAQDHQKTRIAVLWFGNVSDDPEHVHWTTLTTQMVSASLTEIAAINCARGSAIEYAFRKLGIKPGQVIDRKVALSAGRQIGADFILSAQYEPTANGWSVRARIEDAATGSSTDDIHVTGADWYSVRDALVHATLEELHIDPSAEEAERMKLRRTAPGTALAWFSRGLHAQHRRDPIKLRLDYVQKAAKANPESAYIQFAVASICFAQQSLVETATALERALLLDPNLAEGLLLQALLLTANRAELPQAIDKIRTLVQREPTDPVPLRYLGQLLGSQGEWQQALPFLERAVAHAPYDAAIRANLATALLNSNQRDRALAALARAEVLDPDNTSFLDLASRSYAKLGEIPRAVEVAEHFLRNAERIGLAPQYVRQVAQRTKQLRESLHAHPIDAAMPRELTAEQLTQEFSRLTATSRQLIVHPFTGSDEIDAWAQKIIAGLDGDLERSRAIFDVLIRRYSTAKGKGSTRTALDVMAAWNDTEDSFNCQELAKLYLALARSVGLRAFYVHLERDNADRVVYHDCAAVFVEGRAYLVDPAYRWFGAPHKDFVVLDDVQAIGHQTSQPPAGAGRLVERLRLACQLHPNFAWAQIRYARALVEAGKLELAARILKRADSLEEGRWDTLQCGAWIARRQGDWATARTLLEKAIAIHPKGYGLHALLGEVLANTEEFEAARQALQRAMELAGPEENVEAIGQTLAEVQRALQKR